MDATGHPLLVFYSMTQERIKGFTQPTIPFTPCNVQVRAELHSTQVRDLIRSFVGVGGPQTVIGSTGGDKLCGAASISGKGVACLVRRGLRTTP